MKYNPELITTKDGSHSLYLKEIDETYHSRHGAFNESMHVFIKSGLEEIKNKSVSILEIGLGSGLNAFLTLLEAQKKQIKINYTGIEKYPLNYETNALLNFYKNNYEKLIFEKILKAEWNKETEIVNGSFILKIKDDIKTATLKNYYDLVYFDAFAPDKQPEMWNLSIFQKINKQMNKGGILVTYSAKGSVRRTLIEAGFEVERIPGPPGKREMLRAIAPQS